MYKLIVPWKVCANCHQPYQNEPAVDLANEFIGYIERTHPDNRGLPDGTGGEAKEKEAF